MLAHSCETPIWLVV